MFVDHMEGKKLSDGAVFGIVLVRERRLHPGKQLELVSLQALVQ